jgi:hypothetical protein
MKNRLEIFALLVSLTIGAIALVNTTQALAEEDKKEGNDLSGGYIVISRQQTAEEQLFTQRQEALRQQAANDQRDAALKQEYQKHLAESKELSLKKQAARREVIDDLKQKWNKVESSWNDERARHDSAVKEIEEMPEGPERAAKMEAEKAGHRAKSKEIAVERNVVHEGVIEQANREVAGGSDTTSGAAKQTAGTKVTDPNHRGMDGDFDAGGGYRTTEKVEKILNEIGVKSNTGGAVKMKNGVLETSGEFGMTVNADVGADKIGSAGHQAQVKMGAEHGETYVSETGGAVKSQPLKDHLATLDHTKKAMHGLNESPETLVGGSPEGQVMAKGALKAADQAGLPPETIEAIAKQNGIKDPGDLMDKLADIKSGRATITSPEEAAKLQSASRDILKASEASSKAKAEAEVKQTESKISEMESQGKTQEAQKLREELKDYRAKSDAQKEALTDLEKGHPAGEPEPAKSSSKTEAPAEPEGKAGSATEPTAKTGNMPEPIEKTGRVGFDEAPAVRTGNTVETTPGVKAEPDPAAPGGGKVMRGAGLFVGIYGIYEGYQTASKEMTEQKKDEPKDASSWGANKAELVGRTLWHGLGFGSVAEIGKKAGEESYEQYKQDIADGKISKDSTSSYAWMKTRAVLSGLYQTGKAVTYDAAKQAGTGLGESINEGSGLVKDAYGWFKGASDENAVNEDRSKQVYDSLIKKGASPVGAQKAADAVQNGDFTEAKRLNKILEGKLAEKNAATKENDPTDWGKEAVAGLQSIKDAIAQKGKELKEAYEKAQAKYEKEQAAKAAEAAAEANKSSKLAEKASETMAPPAATEEIASTTPELPPGTYEDVSGWIEDKNGKIRLTYIKDASGNTVGSYQTHFDANGNETGRDAISYNNPQENPQGKIDKLPSLDGSYSGTFSGGSGGSISFTVTKGAVSGRISGSYKGDPVDGTFSGTVDATGTMNTSLQGMVHVTTQDEDGNSVTDDYRFTGEISGTITATGPASGNWIGSNGDFAPQGAWTASKR